MKIFAPFLTLMIIVLALLLAYDTLVAVVQAVIIIGPAFVFVAGAAILTVWIWGRVQERRVDMLKALAPQSYHAPAGHSLVIYEPPGARPGNIRNVTLEALASVSPNGASSPAWDMYRQMHGGRQWRTMEPTLPMLPEPEPQPEPILDALLRCKRGMIIGPSDAGKTSTLRFLADASHAMGQVLVIDPKAYNGKWPGCVVIGQGGDYNEIERAVDGLVKLMRVREERMGQGHSDQCPDPIITVIVDEWLLLRHYCPNAPNLLIDLITESRGSNIRVYLVNHDDSVEAWGIRGLGGIRAGVEKFILEYNQQTTRRRAWLVVTQMGQDGKMQRTVKPLVPAGPYYDGNGSGWTVEAPLPPLELSAPAPNGNEADARRILSIPGWASQWLNDGALVGAWQAEIGRQLEIPNAGSYRRRILAVGEAIEDIATTLTSGENGH